VKKILFLLAFNPALLFSQIPDTIFAEALTDSTFLIAIGTKNKNNLKLNIQYLDQVFDSVGVAQYAFIRIEQNENQQHKSDVIKMEAEALVRLYGDVDDILQNFTGAGYLANAFSRYSTKYIGYYKAELGNTVSYFQLKDNAIAEEVLANGDIKIGGFSGTWDVINNNRWRLKGFYPKNILPAGSVLNRLEKPGNTFQAIGSRIVVTKIRATTKE